MKRFLRIALSVFLCAIASSAQAQSLLEGTKWTLCTSVSGHSGTLQGAAYYDGKVYQFTDKGNKYGVYGTASHDYDVL